jgi:hypothetical protein
MGRSSDGRDTMNQHTGPAACYACVKRSNSAANSLYNNSEKVSCRT